MVVSKADIRCSMRESTNNHPGVEKPPFVRAVAQSIGYGTTHTKEEAEGYFGAPGVQLTTLAVPTLVIANVTSIVGCGADEPPMSCLRDASIGMRLAPLDPLYS